MSGRREMSRSRRDSRVMGRCWEGAKMELELEPRSLRREVQAGRKRGNSLFAFSEEREPEPDEKIEIEKNLCARSQLVKGALNLSYHPL
jgi:hypothetical protein